MFDEKTLVILMNAANATTLDKGVGQWKLKRTRDVEDKEIEKALKSYASGIAKEDIFAVYILPTLFKAGGYLLMADAIIGSELNIKNEGLRTVTGTDKNRLPFAGLVAVTLENGSQYMRFATYQDHTQYKFATFSPARDGLGQLLKRVVQANEAQSAGEEVAPWLLRCIEREADAGDTSAMRELVGYSLLDDSYREQGSVWAKKLLQAGDRVYEKMLP